MTESASRRAHKSVLTGVNQRLKKTNVSHRLTQISLIFVNFKNHPEVVQC